jgi:geranylgeranyl pyrophosphate synthase
MEAGGATAETAQLALAGGEHVAPLLRRIEQRLREEAAMHSGELARHGGETVAAGGKRLRPLLLLLAAGSPADAEQQERLVRAGAALELVHSATLVHDDVLDAAALRRGRPTVVAQAGRGAAIATGDALFARAFKSFGDAEQIRILSDACSALARGELLQRADAWDAAIGVDRYLLRCELKTARLFEAACRLGPLATGHGADPGLGPFGRRIGLAFQILDDVLDVSGPAERTGKHRGTDLLDGTVTLPLILARERDADLAALDLRSVRTTEQADGLCERIAATGALEASRERALALVEDAKRELDEAALGAGRARALALVAAGVVARYA